MNQDTVISLRWLCLAVPLLLLAAPVCPTAAAQNGDREDEIVANLAGGRVIVHVTQDGVIVFGAIDQPIEAGSIPPRVMELDSTHVGVLLGASEWRLPVDPQPVRLDRDLQHLTARDPRYGAAPGEAEPDLEIIGTAFLEKLRPLVSQLHHKLEIDPDEPLFELVIIGYAPNYYGPEVWTVEYRVQQEQISTREGYLETRILRPRFEQLYPPEKHAPKTIVETCYPPETKGPTLMQLIQGNDPRVAQLRGGDPRFAKVIEVVDHGQAQKAVSLDAADFLRALFPLVAGKAPFILARMDQEHGMNWIVPPEAPVQKAEKGKEDKERPAGAPTLRKRPEDQ